MAYRDNEPTPQANRTMINDVQQDVAEVRALAVENGGRISGLERRRHPTETEQLVRYGLGAAVIAVMVAVGVVRGCQASWTAEAHDCHRLCRGMGAEQGAMVGTRGSGDFCMCAGPFGSFRGDAVTTAPLSRLSKWCEEACGSYGVESMSNEDGEVRCTCR